MKSIKHILVPVDFSAASDRALDEALSLAERFSAKVTLLHVLPLPGASVGDGPLLSSRGRDLEMEVQLNEVLAAARRRCPSAETVLLMGTPFELIMELAAARDVDLIVMGTCGRRGVSRLLVGSVTETVVRRSPIPVLTFHASCSDASQHA